MSKLPTAEEAKNKVSRKHGYKSWREMEDNLLAFRIPFDEIIESHTAAHTAALREENERLKLALYTITRAYDDCGPMATMVMNKVAKTVLEEIGFDPSKEKL